MRASNAGVNSMWRLLREKNVVVVLAAAAVVLVLLEPRFLTVENLDAISRQIIPVGLLALGQFFVIVSANIDLSLGYAAVLWAIVIGVLFGATGGVLIGLIAVLVLSILFGATQGVITAKLKLPAFIVTLGGLFVARGLGGLIIPREQIFLTDPFFKWVAGQEIFGISASFLIMVALYGAAYLAYNHMSVGAYIVAIGNNEENTRLAGVNVDAVKVGLFAFAGFCAGLSGLVLSGRMGFVQPGIDGNGLLLDAIAAIVIGGTDIRGGRGTVTGTLLGVVFIGVLNNSLNLLNIEDVWQLVYKGVVILAALLINWLLWESRHDET
jgi:ribose/xylose/arabinose/galactoside ABC-type transport system permease subunit